MSHLRIPPALFSPMLMLALAFWLVPPARADLKAALAERDLGKRSKLALDNAAAALKAARAALDKGDTEQISAGAAEMRESIDLAYDSLQSTGKDARKSPKWFKHAEIETRDLLKKLETFEHDLNFQERPVIQDVKTRLQEVHDNLLRELMEGKKK